MAQKDYDANKEQVEAKEKEIESLNAQIMNAQADVDKAQSDYDKALNDYNNTMSPLELAKKNLADFEAQYATELTRLEEGSKGYFESIGCSSDVLNVFNADDTTKNGILASYTDLGKVGDATSFDNLKRSIDYLKEFNQIRVKEGLPEMKVSMWLMAVAQVNANHAHYEHYHYVNDYNCGENLAWAYGEAFSDDSPYRAWYDYEKGQYEAGNTNYNSIGHYLAIVNKTDNITGFAINNNENNSFAQEFGGDYNEVDDITMTVDEFEKSYMSYYNSMKEIYNKHNELQDAVEKADGSSTKDDTALKQAKALLDAKKQVLYGLQSQLTQATNEKDSLTSASADKQKAVDEAQDKVTQAKADVQKKEAVKETSEKALKNAKQTISTKETAKTSAEKALKDAENKVSALNDKISDLTDDINNWDTNKAKANDELAEAKTVLSNAKNTLADAKTALDEANKDLDLAKQAQQDAQNAFDADSKDLENCKATLNVKTGVYDKAKKALQDYNDTTSDVEKAKDNMKSCETKIDDLKASKETTVKKIADLQSEIQAKEGTLSDKKQEASSLEQLKTVLDDVMNQGSHADISSVNDENIKSLLTVLGNDVDKLHVLDTELKLAKNNYMDKYNAYLDAKAELLDAQSKYNQAMSQLNEYLAKESKNNTKDSSTKEDSSSQVEMVKTSVKSSQDENGVNTGVYTSGTASALTAGLALIGLSFAEIKRRKNK